MTSRAVMIFSHVLNAVSCVLIWHGYVANGVVWFYGGLFGLAVGLAVGAAMGGRARAWLGAMAVGTTAFAVSLPLADYVTRPKSVDAQGAEIVPAFSYRAAVADPAAFKLWWDTYLDEGSRFRSAVEMRMPKGDALPHVLRPNARGHFFLNDGQINGYGFRGAPFEVDKGGRYRIVAIGASTTFGATILPGDRTWPEVLETYIQRYMSCPRPVEVLNAGVSGYSVKDNLVRMERWVLPLKPDMVVSFQAYMNFNLGPQGGDLGSQGELRVVPPEVVPPSVERPSRLLASLEHRIRLAALQRRLAGDSGNTYRALYQSLIQMSRAAGVKLVLATSPLAVNRNSPADVIDFYGKAFPDIRGRIDANERNTVLLRDLGREHPDVTIVDTAPGLDGKYEGLYLDLGHFTQWGRNVLAWNMFKGVAPTLVADLGCKPLAGLPDPPREVAVDPWTEADMAKLRQWLRGLRLSPDNLSVERLSPANSTGFSDAEGPYPQWNIPYRFRWMVEPDASIRLHVGAATRGGEKLTWRLLSNAKAQQRATLSLDGKELVSRGLDTPGTWYELTATLPPLSAGRHVLTLGATQFVQYPGDTRRLYVMAGPLGVTRGDGGATDSVKQGGGK